MIRFSLHVFNELDDVERAIQVLGAELGGS
jgi:hypothetical protein